MFQLCNFFYWKDILFQKIGALFQQENVLTEKKHNLLRLESCVYIFGIVYDLFIWFKVGSSEKFNKLR